MQPGQGWRADTHTAREPLARRGVTFADGALAAPQFFSTQPCQEISIMRPHSISAARPPFPGNPGPKNPGTPDPAPQEIPNDLPPENVPQPPEETPQDLPNETPPQPPREVPGLRAGRPRVRCALAARARGCI
ncbi:hypothetical protein DC366_04835 [Pelagivirga sediminicola]|uniref:Uncharacterized protein n=2 Tax=Pelagivirga sediminicola TaxID=2170575 RepID=A0A2T7G9K4_9RHOB|nr:hypothetical protein DC366_04835 [Pelagivirga sediminicola]